MDPTWVIPFTTGMAVSHGGLGKLFATIGEQIGYSLEPYHIRRKALAERDAMITVAKAQDEIAKIQLEGKLELQQLEARADERILKRELRRQKNLERIAAKAAQEMPESVSEKPVDQDWVARFFEDCQDVSNEDMQTIWGRLLAGEVVQPGKYSYRTLSAVKMLNREVANLFTQLCSFVWRSQGELALVLVWTETDYLKQQGLTFGALLRLEQHSLIKYDPHQMFILKYDRTDNGPIIIPFHYFGRLHQLRFAQDQNTVHCGPLMLTDIGRELAEISGAIPNEDYRKSTVKYWRSLNIQIDEQEQLVGTDSGLRP